jgi:hypothetical protein
LYKYDGQGGGLDGYRDSGASEIQMPGNLGNGYGQWHFFMENSIKVTWVNMDE